MSLILNFRGASGAGKSTLVRQIMERVGLESSLGRPGYRPWAYKLNNGLYVLGNYDNQCGGCDGIGSFGQIEGFVRRLAMDGGVLYEGLLYATVFRSSDAFARSMKAAGHHVVFGLLNTPLLVCHQRVLARRQAAGNLKPFPAEKLRTKHQSCWSAQKRLEQAGHDARVIPYQNALETVLEWLTR